jgi:hypothetical protein
MEYWIDLADAWLEQGVPLDEGIEAFGRIAELHRRRSDFDIGVLRWPSAGLATVLRDGDR